jgi:sarcosine oxidase subunit beta
VRVSPGLDVEMQNCWPAPSFNLLKLARLLPRTMFKGGFEHSSLIPSGTKLFQLWERFLGFMAGGAEPATPLPDRVTAIEATAIVAGHLVVGGGPSGCRRANELAQSGHDVVLVSRGEGPARHAMAWGERAPEIDPRVRTVWGIDIFGAYRNGSLLLGASSKTDCGLVAIHAESVVLATGKCSLPPLVPGAWLPGVMDEKTALELACNYGIAPGERVLIVGNGILNALEERLKDLGVNVVGVLQYSELKNIVGHASVRAVDTHFAGRLAEQPPTGELLTQTRKLHERCGIESRLLSPRELRSVLPAVAHDRVHSSLLLPGSGVAPHHAAMHAFLTACTARGVKVSYRTRVITVEKHSGYVTGVQTDKGFIGSDTVVIAAGAHSPKIAGMAGVELEGYAMRLEAMALEPTRPLITPAVALLDRLCYMHQTARGEVVGGCEVAERPQNTLNADVPVMAATAKAYLEMFPQLAHARILRQWGGLVHISPDFGPMMGAHPDLGGLFVSAGWCYGHAGAPAAGELLAKLIAKGELDWRIKPFSVDRFRQSRPVREPGIVLSHYD